jgi:hypothetical protein
MIQSEEGGHKEVEHGARLHQYDLTQTGPPGKSDRADDRKSSPHCATAPPPLRPGHYRSYITTVGAVPREDVYVGRRVCAPFSSIQLQVVLQWWLPTSFRRRVFGVRRLSHLSCLHSH